MAEGKVKVRFTVSLTGYHSGEMEMSRDDFERLDALQNAQLCEEIGERMNWSGVESEVEWCHDFEVIPNV